jgi:hypothetical protein
MIATFSLHLPMDDSHFGYKEKFIQRKKKNKTLLGKHI